MTKNKSAGRPDSMPCSRERTLIASLLVTVAVAVASLLPPMPASGQTTDIVSLNSAGVQGDNDSWLGSTSDDGRFVVFESEAANLVDLDGDGVGDPDVNGVALDVFVRDRATGMTELISINSAGVQADAGGRSPAISADGRYVTFSSGAANLVDADGDGAFDDDTNGAFDIFVHDRATRTTEIVSVNSLGVQGAGSSFPSRISADGRYVVFSSQATNLIDLDGDGVIDPDMNGTALDTFVHDRVTGTTEIVSINTAGEQGDRDSSLAGAFSADGRYVAFLSSATNLVDIDGDGVIDADANGFRSDVFVHDRVTRTTEIVHVNSAGEQGNGPINAAEGIDISRDGRYVAFESNATNLVDIDADGVIDSDGNGFTSDVFVHDRLTGRTEIVSVNSLGVQGNNQSIEPSLIADGSLVAFRSQAQNLVDLDGDGIPDADTNNNLDVFIRDRSTGITETVSVNSAGDLGDNASNTPKVSPDGRFVIFTSLSANLVDSDGDGVFDDDATLFRSDIFVRDRMPPGPSTAPELFVTSPQPGAVVPAAPVAVAGTATDDVAVATVAVNGTFASLSSTGNPDDPAEVAFSIELPLEPGPHTIVVVATDNEGNETEAQLEIDLEAPDVLQCDVDADGVVDRADIALIFAARGLDADGPDDPRDANGDGAITVNDARLCVLRCANAGCAPD